MGIFCERGDAKPDFRRVPESVLREILNVEDLLDLKDLGSLFYYKAVIVVDRSFSGIDLNPENKVAYFREDIALNTAHWVFKSFDTYPRFSFDPKQQERFKKIYFLSRSGMLFIRSMPRLDKGIGNIWHDDTSCILPKSPSLTMFIL